MYCLVNRATNVVIARFSTGGEAAQYQRENAAEIVVRDARILNDETHASEIGAQFPSQVYE